MAGENYMKGAADDYKAMDRKSVDMYEKPIHDVPISKRDQCTLVPTAEYEARLKALKDSIQDSSYMTADKRAKFVQNFLNEHCLKVMNTKGADYSRHEDDVNSNFKRVGTAVGLDPLVVAYVYMAKHWDAITAYIKRGKSESEPIEGRIGDMINYLLIVASLIEEGRNV